MLLLHARGVRPRRAAADLHGRRARAAQRRVYLDDPHTRDDNRWMHRPRDGLGGGRAAARPGRRSRAACGRGCGGWSRPAARTRGDPRPGRRPSRSGPATTTSSGSCASRRARRCWSSANFTADPQPVALDVVRCARVRAHRRGDRPRRPPRRGLPRLRRAGALPAPLASPARSSRGTGRLYGDCPGTWPHDGCT